MPLIERTDLRCTLGTSDKVYHVGIYANAGGSYAVVTAYGPTGRARQQPVSHTSNYLSVAQNQMARLVASKLRKGYVESPGISGNIFGPIEEVDPAEITRRRIAALADHLDTTRERERQIQENIDRAASAAIVAEYNRLNQPIMPARPPVAPLGTFANPHRRVARPPIPPSGVRDVFGNIMTEDVDDV